jgi:hypothetical protein
MNISYDKYKLYDIRVDLPPEPIITFVSVEGEILYKGCYEIKLKQNVFKKGGIFREHKKTHHLVYIVNDRYAGSFSDLIQLIDWSESIKRVTVLLELGYSHYDEYKGFHNKLLWDKWYEYNGISHIQYEYDIWKYTGTKKNIYFYDFYVLHESIPDTWIRNKNGIWSPKIEKT